MNERLAANGSTDFFSKSCFTPHTKKPTLCLSLYIVALIGGSTSTRVRLRVASLAVAGGLTLTLAQFHVVHVLFV